MAQRGLRRTSVKKAFDTSRVNLPGQVEVIYQPIYDYQTLAAAAVSSQKFFQLPQGQGGKVLADTNMDLAGNLPKGQAFQITGIQIEILPGVDIATTGAALIDNDFANDVYAVLKGGALVLKIGSKEYVQQGNLMKFPPVNRLSGFTSTAISTTVTATTVAATNMYAAGGGREFSVADLLLESSQNFSVELQDLAALPSTVAGRVGVTLNGFLFRNAQ